MSKSKVIVSLVSLLLSSQVFAAPRAEINKKSNGDFEIQFCDSALPGLSVVGFQIGRNGIIQKDLLKSDSCTTKTYSNSLSVEGKQLFVHKMSKRADDMNSQGILLETTIRARTSSGSNNNSGSSAITFDNIRFDIKVLENREGEAYKIEIKVCHPNFTVRDAVVVTNRATMGSSQLISKSSTVTNDKCFKTNYLKGEIQDRDVIGIGLYSVAKPIELTLVGVPWRRSSASTPPRPQPSPTPVPQPTPTPPGSNLLIANRGEIIENARRAADSFAKNLSKNLGQIENIRYNLYLGFKNEERRAVRYGQDVRNLNEYRYGYDNGVRIGQQDGFSAGQNFASQRANEYARADVGAAVDAIMNGQARELNIRRRQNLGQKDFQGLDMNITTPATVTDRLRNKDRELQNDLNNQFFIRDQDIVLADDILDGRFQVYQLYGVNEYKFDLLDSYFRESKAFEAWTRGYFQPRQNLVRYYNDISDSQLYENASANRQLFRSEFERQYDRVIAHEWNQVVRRERYEIQRMGENLYVDLTLEYAQALGDFDGKKLGYRNSSRDGYLGSIQARYNAAVEQTAQNVQSQSVITDVSVKAVSSDGDLDITLGESIDLILSSAANRGMKDGQVVVAPVATSDVIAIKGAATQALPAFSKLNSPVIYKGMLAFNRVTAPDQDVVVNYTINGQPARSTLRSTFEGLVVGLTRTTNAQVQSAAVQTVVIFLNREWEEKKAVVGDGFNNNRGDLLVERLAARAQQMSPAEKAVLKRFAQQIKDAYGKRPNWSVYSGDHDSVMEILKKAGL